MRPPWMFCLLCLFFSGYSPAQRVYKTNSVLASGEWFTLQTQAPGIYRIDLPFLKKLGLNVSNIASGSIRLYGNGGGMLPENCSAIIDDDLREVSLYVEDGGDGILNGQDYILFYAPGPHQWVADAAAKRFHFIKNLYTESSTYFLTIGSGGKRVQVAPGGNPTTDVRSYLYRSSYVLDSFNFLGSGKDWYGDEFANAPGKQVSRSYSFKIPARLISQPVYTNASYVARSVGGASRFNLTANGVNIFAVDVPATTSIPTDPFAKAASGNGSQVIPQNDVQIKIDFTPGSFNAQGWLDQLEINVPSSLELSGFRQLDFRDFASVANGQTARFNLQHANNRTQVWEVTNASDPLRMTAQLSGPDLQFVNDCSRLREYIAFEPDSAFSPIALGRINNQNLHAPAVVDMIIIAHENWLAEANRLAQFHQQKDKLRTVVVPVSQVYNEFSSGSPDPAAIRDFVKMFYDRAKGDSTLQPKYLLLFGDASFDYKNRINNNTNYVPAYESSNSLDPLNTYTSDDFFGFLDDQDNINDPSHLNLLDIGIGRIPIRNADEAKHYVDKVIAYTSPSSMGAWRNRFTFVADDEDFNLHLHDAETITSTSTSVNPLFVQDKIYLDAYQQISGAGGARYPDANRAIDENIFNGTLLFNYTGHGGFRRLAEEDVLDQEIIDQFNNPDRLPLFITATCDFAPYDDPRNNSIGENVLLREKSGAIALMTTTRLVFAFSNRIMNQHYLEVALKRKADGTYLSLGEAAKQAKNLTYRTYGDIANNRKFTLLGDPALTIAFPTLQVSTDEINGKPAQTGDTVKALQRVSIRGSVKDANGNFQNQFRGEVHVAVFDKKEKLTTKGNDPDSYAESFTIEKNLIYQGKAQVAAGIFSLEFIVPKDINYQLGPGSISYYVQNGQADGNGRYSGMIVGGSDSLSSDVTGPYIRAFLNDEKFVNGSITNERPVLIVKLKDSSGINILGRGIGHDMVAELDHDPKKIFVLNDMYEADLDSYKSGSVRYQLPKLEPGRHSLTIKAWDVANNSSEIELDFEVSSHEKIELDHVLNYPNPFTTHTSFWFAHNHPGEQLTVKVRIFTVTGRLVKTIAKNIISPGTLVTDIDWDGKDEYGSRLGRGVYVYMLEVNTPDGKTSSKVQKLLIL